MPALQLATNLPQLTALVAVPMFYNGYKAHNNSVAAGILAVVVAMIPWAYVEPVTITETIVVDKPCPDLLSLAIFGKDPSNNFLSQLLWNFGAARFKMLAVALNEFSTSELFFMALLVFVMFGMASILTGLVGYLLWSLLSMVFRYLLKGLRHMFAFYHCVLGAVVDKLNAAVASLLSSKSKASDVPESSASPPATPNPSEIPEDKEPVIDLGPVGPTYDDDSALPGPHPDGFGPQPRPKPRHRAGRKHAKRRQRLADEKAAAEGKGQEALEASAAEDEKAMKPKEERDGESEQGEDSVRTGSD